MIIYTNICIAGLIRPSDMVQLNNGNYAKFSGQILQLERPIMW